MEVDHGGLVVLRLVDDWLDHGAPAIAKNPASVQAVREALAQVPQRDPVLPVLCELTNIVTQSEHASVTTIAPHMFNYGEILHTKGRWTLSRDVFLNLLKYAGAAEDHATAALTARRLGFILKRLGLLDASNSFYAIAVKISSAINQPDISLNARIGSAGILIFRGLLTEAETALGLIEAEAERLDLTYNLDEALSLVACARNDYRAALRWYRTAVRRATNSVEKEHQLLNLGGALVGCGDHSAAKKSPDPSSEQGTRRK